MKLLFLMINLFILIIFASCVGRTGGASAVVIKCEAPFVIGDFQSGSGSASSPYAICNLDQLTHFSTYCSTIEPSNCLGMNFALGDNIDLTAQSYSPVVTFRGTFNGNSKTVSNWNYTAGDSADSGATIEGDLNHPETSAGFFRNLGDGAIVKNLTLTNLNLWGRYYTGALVGYMKTGSAVSNCHVTTAGLVADVGTDTTGIVIGYNDHPTGGGSGHTGGLVGLTESGTSISDSSFAGLVRGAMHTGGLVGNLSGSITNSHTSGAVKGRDGNNGGFVGNMDAGSTVSKSYSTSTVIETSGNSGGFVGSLQAGTSVTTSYFNGSMTGNSLATGGFVGYIGGAGAIITKSYSAGTVNGNGFVGGFAGWIISGAKIEDSYSLSTVASADWAGGFAGVISTAGIGTINRVYSVGATTSAGVHAGDLVGYLGNTGVVTNSFADDSASVGGLVNTPNAGTITNSLAESTANMKLDATYTGAGWSFPTVWIRSDGANSGFPQLK